MNLSLKKNNTFGVQKHRFLSKKITLMKMKKNIHNIKYITTLCIFFLLQSTVFAQLDKNIADYSRDEVLELSYDQLLELELNDLLKLAEIAGVSLDELYEIVLNKDVEIASKSSEQIFQSPLSTSVLTSEEIIASGANSIAEALRLIPGFIIREKTNGNFDVQIRGNDNIPPGNLMLFSENRSTLVMIDGRLVFNYVFGGTLWESIPISLIDIERIEVVRGPAGALYGPNAVNGVINIITKKSHSQKLQSQAIVEYGNFNSLKTEAAISKSFNKKINFRLSGNYQQIERTQTDIYMWPLGGYRPVSFIDSVNPWNKPQPIKPNGSSVYFPNPELALQKYGANLSTNFNLNKNINFHLSANLQNSEVISSIIDDSFISESRRGVSSKAFDLTANIYKSTTQFSYTDGWMNASIGSDGFEFDYNILQFKTEYDWVILDKLHIQPGFGFDRSVYDDSNYLSSENLLNGEKTIEYLSFNLRMDYTFFEKLRFIAAVRAENYNNPSDTYFPFQFVASYKINDKNILRAVQSRSNTSPFMVDMYTNFDWKRVPVIPGVTSGLNIRFDGNTDLKLITMDMSEIGYRAKPFKNIQIDIELFHSHTKNLSALMADSVHVLTAANGLPINLATGKPIYDPITQKPFDYIHVKYENLDLTSEQYGISANIDFMFGENFRIKLFGTWQKTKLSDYYALTIDQTIGKMTESVYAEWQKSWQSTGNPFNGVIGGGIRPSELSNIENNYTPSFYGGLFLIFTPSKKLTISRSIYFYSQQEYVHKYATTTIESKVIFNMKIDYKIHKQSSIYFNARNMFNDDEVEFGFLDKNAGKYSLGLTLNF